MNNTNYQNKLNIDSPYFDAKQYFKNFVKDKSIEEVINKNNQLFQGKPPSIS